ncbi:HepT-like ribonuclease domain-containing protein [Hydrogenimonas sp. SS33]|uniref:HepT-like ribonuclease domain-containing protein n=1 Tax=Hydrogenimonas leucolamina TaxID=2954236 RepID=UPI00336C2016
MSYKSERAKIDFILEMIENIERIEDRHGGVVSALEDFEGKMAILMGLAQIGETLKKLDDTFIEKAELAREKEGAYFTRNYIVHDYEGIDLYIVEDILVNHLPVLKHKLAAFQSGADN